MRRQTLVRVHLYLIDYKLSVPPNDFLQSVLVPWQEGEDTKIGEGDETEEEGK